MLGGLARSRDVSHHARGMSRPRRRPLACSARICAPRHATLHTPQRCHGKQSRQATCGASRRTRGSGCPRDPAPPPSPLRPPPVTVGDPSARSPRCQVPGVVQLQMCACWPTVADRAPPPRARTLVVTSVATKPPARSRSPMRTITPSRTAMSRTASTPFAGSMIRPFSMTRSHGNPASSWSCSAAAAGAAGSPRRGRLGAICDSGTSASGGSICCPPSPRALKET